MAATVSAVWRGNEAKRRVLAALVGAMDATMSEAADVCAGLTPVDTGRLQGSMGAVPTQVHGDHVTGAFGSVNDSPPYAIFVEAGTRRMSGRYMIRRAADQVLPTFPANVKARL